MTGRTGKLSILRGALALLLLVFLFGCSTSEEEPMAGEDEVLLERDLSGEQDAPPFSQPRAKIAPDEVVRPGDEADDEDAEG